MQQGRTGTRTTQRFVALLVAILFFFFSTQEQQLVLAAPAQITVHTRYADNKIPSQVMWDGNEYINVSITGQTFDVTKLDDASPAILFQEKGGATGQANGPQAFESTMLPNASGVLAFKNSTYLSFHFKPAPGFVVTSEVTYGLDFASYTDGITGGNVPPGLSKDANVFIVPPTTAGQALYSTNQTNEYDIRAVGMTIRAQLKYNVFSTESPPVVSSANAALNTGWTFQFITYGIGKYEVVATLPADATFQLAEGTTASVTMALGGNTNQLIGGVLTPPSATFFLSSVDNTPVAYCLLTKSTFTDKELRDGTATTTVILSPSDAHEEFLTDAASELLWKDGTVVPFGLAVTRVLKKDSVDITISTTQTGYDINAEQQISVTPDKRVLKSGEAGCGIFAIIIQPAQGELLGRDTRNLLETDINTRDISMNFDLSFDVFVVDKMQVDLQVRQIIVNSEVIDGITRGAATTLVPNTRFNISANGLKVTVVIKATPSYNIPRGMVEEITIGFKQNSTESTKPPFSVNATFNISGVQPTITAVLNSTGKPSVPVETLWTGDTVIALKISGDLWDPTSTLKWNFNHPSFVGIFEKATPDYSFSAFHTKTDNYVRYSDVIMQGNVAYLPISAMKGLTLRFEERVDILEVTPMIEGPKVKEIIARTNFVVTPAAPSQIVVIWGGDALSGKEISETDVRQGLTFSIHVLNEGLNKDRVISNFEEVFPTPKSLANYINTTANNITFDIETLVPEKNIFNQMRVTFPPYPDYDITSTEIIELIVPNSWYVWTTPARAAKSVLRIRSEPSPQCTLKNFPIAGIDEGTVRRKDTLITLELTKRLRAGLANDLQNKVINFTYSSLHEADKPLEITFYSIGIFSLTGLDKIEFLLRRNASYEITSKDQVYLKLDRQFFADGETCDNTVNFTIGVLPGKVTYIIDNAATMSEEIIRDHGLNITIHFADDNVKVNGSEIDRFLLEVAVVEPGETANSSNLASLLNPLRINATKYNSSTFVATLPPLAHYDIFSSETVHLRVPVGVLESQQAPSYTNNVLVIRPSPGTINATFNATITETDVSQGGQQVWLQLSNEEWDPVNVLADLRQETIDSIAAIPDAVADQETRTGLTRVFAPSAFRLLDNKTVLITMQQDFKFDSVADMAFEIRIPENVTNSKLVPVPNVFSITVTSMPGRLVVSGSGVRTSTRQMVLGGVQVRLTLENDLFIKRELSPRELCPSPKYADPNVQPIDCSLILEDPNADFARVLILQFTNKTDYFIEEDTYYNISVPARSIKSGFAVNNETIFVYVESGVLAPVPQLVGKEFTETTFRTGSLSKIEFTVGGDKFVTDPTVVVSAITRSLRCVPASDAFGFCSRAKHMLHAAKGWNADTSQKKIVISLQPDVDFDIAVDQTVYIDVAGLAMKSGLKPFSQTVQSFVIKPSIGLYFYSASTTSVVSEQLAKGFQDKTKIVQIVLTLYGERWIANPTQLLIAGFTSTSPIQRESNGFMKWKQEMFYGAKVSENGRVLTIAMKPYSGYVINFDEQLSFPVSALAVQGGVAPTQLSLSNSMLIHATTAVEFVNSRIYSAATFLTQGVNLTLKIHAGHEWEPVSGKMFSAAMESLSNPGVEPNGFEALKGNVNFVVPVDRSAYTVIECLMSVAPAFRNNYYLKKKETLRLTIPRNWIVARITPWPMYFDIVIDPQLKTVVAMVENPVDRIQLVKQLAKAVGVSTEVIHLEKVENYGDIYNKWSKVHLVFSESTIPGERPADDNVEFLLKQSKDTMSSCCNVGFLYLAAAEPPEKTINENIGLSTAERDVERNNSLVWVWVMIALLVVASVGGAIYYMRNIRDAQYSGMNRTFPDDADTFGAKLILSNDPNVTGGARSAIFRKDGDKIRGNDFASTIDTSTELKQLNVDNDEDDQDLPQLAGKNKSNIRIDVDEMMQRGQPVSLFEKKVFVANLVRPQPPPKLSREDVMAIYPPEMPHAQKFVSKNNRSNSKINPDLI